VLLVGRMEAVFAVAEKEQSRSASRQQQRQVLSPPKQTDKQDTDRDWRLVQWILTVK
jgi:hypothetical protein